MMLPFALPVALFIRSRFLQVGAAMGPGSDNDSPGEPTFPSSRSRITAPRAAWVMDRLGDRDVSIVRTLDRVRVASARQLERVHFFSSTPLSNARACRATLARLARWRVLTRLNRRVGGVRSGSAGFVYALDVVGQRLLDKARRLDGSRTRRAWTPSASLLDHALGVSEVFVRLVEAERGGQLQVLEFETEPNCWRSFHGAGGEVVVVKPDAFVRLGIGEYEEHVFVEADRGTESTRALDIKFDRYRLYWASGREQAAHDVFPRVVWLVPNAKRYSQLVDVAARQPTESWRLFQVGLHEDAVVALMGKQS